jgi:outer membrane murein-binding lipoprotein Lpp
MRYNPLIVLAVAAVVVVGSGCASNSRVDDLELTTQATQKTIDEASSMAAQAESDAARAQATADQALATANAANMTAEEANEKVDRAFKSSMEK